MAPGHRGWWSGAISRANQTFERSADRRCNALLGSGLQPRKKVEQFAPVTADERVLGHLLAAGRQRCCNPDPSYGRTAADGEVKVAAALPTDPGLVAGFRLHIPPVEIDTAIGPNP